MSRASRAAARPLGVLALAAGLVAVTGAASYAASTTLKDTTGDVYSVTKTGKTSLAKGVKAPDITRATTTYAGGVITTRIKLKGLAKGTEFNLAVLDLRTSNGTEFVASGAAVPGFAYTQVGQGADGSTPVECDGAATAVKRAAKEIDIIVPASCVGDPASVRAGVAVFTVSTKTAEFVAIDVAGKKRISTHWFRSPTTSLPFTGEIANG